jgi:hypothetical protein
VREAARARAAERLLTEGLEAAKSGDPVLLDDFLSRVSTNVEALGRGPGGNTWRDHWRTLDERAASGVDWTSATPPRPRWILRQARSQRTIADGQGVLARGIVGLVVAQGGAGKTQFLAQLAVAVALPREAHDTSPGRFSWGGRGGWEIEDTGPVLLVLGEEDEGEAHRRVHRALLAYGLLDAPSPQVRAWLDIVRRRLVVVAGAGVPGLALTRPPGRDGAALSNAAYDLRRLLDDTDEPWALVVLDPLSRFAGADAEKDQHAATVLVQALEFLAGAPGSPAVVVAHHSSQNARSLQAMSSSDARGVTALSDGVRWQAGIRPRPRVADAPSLLDLAVTKSNRAMHPPSLPLVRGNDGAFRVATRDELTAYELAHSEADTEAPAKPRRSRPTATNGSATNGAGWRQ